MNSGFLILIGILTVPFPSSTLSEQKTSVHSIYFQNNSYQLGKKEKNILDQVSKECSSPKFTYLKIFAYADPAGSIEYNNLLSKKRADVVYKYISARTKIDTSKIYITWLGESIDEGYDLHFRDAHLQQKCVDILVYLNDKQ